MLRMEIALILVLGFVAYIYYSAERTQTALHRTFSALLAAALVHLVFDVLTLYTVNHLDTVPRLLNDALHRVFVGTMVLVVFLFYQYIAILVEEETGKPRRLDLAARIFLAAAEAGVLSVGCVLLAAVAVLLGRENRILIAAALAALIIVNAIAVALSQMQREA